MVDRVERSVAVVRHRVMPLRLIFRAGVLMRVSEYEGRAVLSRHRSLGTRWACRASAGCVCASEHRGFDGSLGAEQPIQCRLIAEQTERDAARPSYDATGNEDETVADFAESYHLFRSYVTTASERSDAGR